MRICLLTLSILSFSIKTNAAESDLTLRVFLQAVEEANLDLKSEEARFASYKSVAKGVRIPAPSISYIQRNFKNESAKGFEISQSFPFPGKVTSENRARDENASASNHYLDMKKNEVLSMARLTFIEYWLQYEKISIFKEKYKIISDHIKLSRSVARSNSRLKIYLFKSLTDLNLLENEIFKQEQVLFEIKIKMAGFLNKPATYSPPRPVLPLLSEIESFEVLDTPQVKALESRLLAAQAVESENKKIWIPDLKLSYMELSSTSMMAEHSQFSVGITMPFIFPWEPNAKSTEASALRRISEYQLEKEKKIIEYAQARLLEESKTLKKQLSLIENQLLPRAKETMKLVNNIAPRDKSSLQDHRDAMEAFIDLRLQALSLRGRLEAVASELLKFTPQKEYIYE